MAIGDSLTLEKREKRKYPIVQVQISLTKMRIIPMIYQTAIRENGINNSKQKVEFKAYK